MILLTCLLWLGRSYALGEGGTFHYALRVNPVTLNPITASDNYGIQVMRWMAESLLRRDEDTYGWVPALAESYQVSNDGRTFDFELRRDVRFHDGTELTAEDVAFSITVHASGLYGAAGESYVLRNFDRVTVTSPHHLRVHAKNVLFFNLNALATLPIVPKKIYGDCAQIARLNQTVIGTGPYRLKEYKVGSRLVLERNPSWWGRAVSAERGRFNFGRVVVHVVEDDLVRLQMLEKGDLDFAELKLDAVLKQTDHKPWGEKVFVETSRAIDVFTSQRSYFLNLRRPIFAGVKTRRALQMLLDRDQLNAKFRGGKSLLATGPWHRRSEYADQTLAPVPFDEARARALLAEDGWIEAENGMLTRVIDGRPTPFRFTFTFATRDAERELSVYQASLRKVGIQMDLRQVDWGALVQSFADRNFDAYVVGRGAPGDVDFDPNSEWNSKYAGADGANVIGYVNKEVDALLERAERELDRSHRIQLLKRAYRSIANDQPQVFTFSEPEEYYARSARVKIPKPYFRYLIGMDRWRVE